MLKKTIHDPGVSQIIQIYLLANSRHPCKLFFHLVLPNRFPQPQGKDQCNRQDSPRFCSIELFRLLVEAAVKTDRHHILMMIIDETGGFGFTRPDEHSGYADVAAVTH
jgi:hypothetical protein